jgi:hypothetical protein
MTRFSEKLCITHGAEDVDEFVHGHLMNAESVLFIGTVGIEPSSLHFPSFLLKSECVHFRFFIETRNIVSPTLHILGERHRSWLEENISNGQYQFTNVQVISDDGATVAGRNAVNEAAKWYDKNYNDIVIDSSGMSRGICFPVLRQAIAMGERLGANVHLLVASNDNLSIKLKTESNDRADWMHGFQGRMGLDTMSEALTLWIPQLAQGGEAQMSTMLDYLSSTSSVAEVCPIVPFPSINPRRGDELLFEYRNTFPSDWQGNHLNVIYAHEADPLDVFRSIIRMESARRDVFLAANKKAVSVLSPSGWRIGSLGMVLAAIEFDLPLLYVEAIGYTTESDCPPSLELRKPDRQWHIWIAGAPYAHLQKKT